VTFDSYAVVILVRRDMVEGALGRASPLRGENNARRIIRNQCVGDQKFGRARRPKADSVALKIPDRAMGDGQRPAELSTMPLFAVLNPSSVWFGVLNKDFRYQLTAIGASGPNLYVAEEITDNPL
jgi:hypothetical protein